MDPKKLRKQYMQLVPHLNKAIKHVQTQLADLPPSDFELETNLKPYTSIKRKMETDRVRDPVELSDLARGRIFFSKEFNVEDVIGIVQKLFGEQMGKVQRNNHASTEHGLKYQGIAHIDINIDGTNFELQIMPTEFKPHKELLHQIYEKFRTPKELDKMSDTQKNFLRKTHNELYKKIHQQAETNRHPKEDD